MNGAAFNQQQNPTPPMPTPTPTSPHANEKQNMFAVQILILIFFLIFLTGILNYFNILPLSSLFPNYLGILPHKEQNNKPISQPTQTPVNYSPNIFQYDSKKAKAILTSYIKDNIKPEFLSQTLDIKQGLSIDNRLEAKILR
jgi:hypothetical protein